MEYLKINQVYWDNKSHALFVWTDEISIIISFHQLFTEFSNKWVGWRKAKMVFINKVPADRMPKTTGKPPIRNIQSLVENVIKRFKIRQDNTDKEVIEFMLEKRKG